MLKEEVRAWRLVGLLAAIALMIGGAVLASRNGANVSSVAYVLIVLGGLAAGCLGSTILMPKRLGRFLRVPALIAVVIGLAGIVLSVSLSFSGDRAVILGLQGLAIYYVAAAIAMLFLVSMGLFVASVLSETKLKATKLLAYIGGAAAAAEGLAVIGIAADTYITGLGTVLARTIQLLGTALFAAAVIFIAVSLLAEWSKRGVPAISITRSAFAVIIFFAGIALTVLATPIDIKGIGGIMQNTVMLAGLQLALIGLFTLALCGLSANPESPRTRRLAMLAAVFLAFLVPMAVLTAGNVL